MATLETEVSIIHVATEFTDVFMKTSSSPAPIVVEYLFAAEPKLFAYELPSFDERNRAREGDLVKLFFQLDEYVRPRPIWVVVKSVETSDCNKRFVGQIWDRYSEQTQRQFGPIEFDASHIYRVPLNRTPVENPMFDVDYRDELRA